MHHLRRAMQYRQDPGVIFLQNYAQWRVSQVRSLTPNFTVMALKMWAYRRQNLQNR